MNPIRKERVCILVKAYPQPSQKYVETVCCAGITESGELIRLFPISFRQLNPEQRFDRFDWIEGEVWHAENDHRPESHKISPESIKIISRKKSASGLATAKIWLPHVEDSFPALKLKNNNPPYTQSLGIVKPDAGSIKFKIKSLKDLDSEDRETLDQVYQQSLLYQDDGIKPLPRPSCAFEYHFSSGGKPSKMTIHDWEVQAAWVNYQRLYGDEAEQKLQEMYQVMIPSHNLHLIMGTQLSRPQQFMIIGLLRAAGDLEQAQLQTSMF